MSKKSIKERFLSKIQIGSNSNDCWIWIDSPCTYGGGQMRINGKKQMATRISYNLFIGEIPLGRKVLHKCKNKLCVNPKHLILSKILTERFWEKVNIIDSDKCCKWLSTISNSTGYGSFWYGKKQELAHRISYILEYGHISDNLLVLHKCDNPACVNPRHLFLGTHADNSSDMVEKNRQAKGEKHGMSKLSKEQIIIIKNKYIPEIYSTRKLAKEFNVSQPTIWRIINNITWKHI